MSKKSDQEFLKHLQEKANNGENIFPLAHDSYGAISITADQVEPKPQPWFWKNVIPLDTATLFAGFGGTGKSQLLIFMAAKTTTGEYFQAGGINHSFPKGRVIILSGEDDFSYQLVPRLIAANANLSKCHLLKMMKAPGKPTKLLDLDAHLSLLEDLIEKYKESEDPVRLVIIDPVQYFTGEMRDHIGAMVCRFIASLNDMSKQYGLATIMNKHLRKKGDGEGISSAVDSVSGSGTWTTSPRACWLIHRHPTKSGLVLFADLKANLKARDTQSLAFQIDQISIQNGDINTTALTWSNELESLNADEALNTRCIPPVEQAVRDWIVDFLLKCNENPNNGAMFEAAALYREALSAGFKRKIYYKAKGNMLEDGIVKESVEGNTRKTLMLVLSDPESYN